MLRCAEDDLAVARSSQSGSKRVPCGSGPSGANKKARPQHQQPENDYYFPTTRLPLPEAGGWLLPCRYCRVWTSASVISDGDEVAICKRCQSKLSDYITSVVARSSLASPHPAQSFDTTQASQCFSSDTSDVSSSPSSQEDTLMFLVPPSHTPSTSTASPSLVHSASCSGHSTPRCDPPPRVPFTSPSCLLACLLAAQAQQQVQLHQQAQQQLQHQQQQQAAGEGGAAMLCRRSSIDSSEDCSDMCSPPQVAPHHQASDYASGGAHGLLQRLVAQQQHQQLMLLAQERQ